MCRCGPILVNHLREVEFFLFVVATLVGEFAMHFPDR